MSQNVPKLNAKQIQAAALLAADELSDEAIAEQVGVSRKTLQRWREIPDFLDAMNEHNLRVQAAMLRLDIAKRHKRVAVLDDLHRKALVVIDERSVALAGKVAGGGTGLLADDVKGVGAGPSAVMVDVYAVDTPLMREIRALHEQAAKELGQWTDKVEQSGGVTVQLIGVDMEAI